jgi:hypothetical protein
VSKSTRAILMDSDAPLVADLRGLEPRDGTVRCPGCGARAQTLYVTPRKLSRCAHCFSPRIAVAPTE